jgi:hypothetical protein
MEEIATIGLGIAKRAFQVHGVDDIAGKIVHLDKGSADRLALHHPKQAYVVRRRLELQWQDAGRSAEQDFSLPPRSSPRGGRRVGRQLQHHEAALIAGL